MLGEVIVIMKSFLIRLNIIVFVFVGILSLFLTSFITHVLLMFRHNGKGPDLFTESIIEVVKTISVTGIIVPIVETFLFQYIVFLIIKRFLSSKKYFFGVFMISSSLLFAVAHTYSLFYVLLTLFMGGILAYCYYIMQFRKESAFWIVAVIHASYNVLLVVTSYLFDI